MSTSFDRLLKSSRLAMPAIGADQFIADRSIRLTRPDREQLNGKVSKSRASGGGSSGAQKLVNKLAKRLKTRAPRSAGKLKTGGGFDARQRAVVKIHYFSHAGGGAAALRAHGKYIDRDATAHEGPSLSVADDEAVTPKDKSNTLQAHADYLERGGERGRFYDAAEDAIDGHARLDTWARSDQRHFRIILSAEESHRLRDLPAYTREVMARAGSALGTTLSWVAVDHRDTDNAHTHIVVRGRRANGQDLVMPRDFIKHGFRSIARDVATEWLGERTREQERLALDRDARRHGPSRLDRLIDAQAPGGELRQSDLRAPNGETDLTRAMKARVQELERMGLATPKARNVFQLAPDWRERLKAMELHIDVRKRVVRERAERGLAQQHAARQVRKGLLDR